MGGGNGSLGNKKTFVPDRQLPSTSPIRETSATERPVFFSLRHPSLFLMRSLSLFFSLSLARSPAARGRPFHFLKRGRESRRGARFKGTRFSPRSINRTFPPLAVAVVAACYCHDLVTFVLLRSSDSASTT